MTIIFDHSFSEIEPEVLYDLLRLRSEIFVVEQSSIYLDLDGCDTDSLTRHIWMLVFIQLKSNILNQITI